jgi:hypothetical protein
MKTRQYEKQLEYICKQAECQVELLAIKFREEVLIPACKRAKMEYLSGNGTFAFFGIGNDMQICDTYDAKRYKKSYLIPVIEELNCSVFNSNVQCFGFYVANVKENDLV